MLIEKSTSFLSLINLTNTVTFSALILSIINKYITWQKGQMVIQQKKRICLELPFQRERAWRKNDVAS